MRNKILIYNDEGCSGVQVLAQCTEQHFSSKNVQTECVSADDIIKKDCLNENVLAFIMPGGAATPFLNKLRVLGNDKIRSYVERGGVYFGICAGAYYACRKIAFEQDVPEAALEQYCELNLIEACARGTLKEDFGLTPYVRPTPDNAAVVDVVWREDGEHHGTLYHGGPKFELMPEEKDAEILAYYKDAKGQPPAVLVKRFGKGTVLVSGVHFEDDEKSLRMMSFALPEYEDKINNHCQIMRTKEKSRQNLTAKLMAVLDKNRISFGRK